MAQSFELQPFQTARIKFIFRADWQNEIRVTDPVNGEIIRGNDAGSQEHIIQNQTMAAFTVTVRHFFKTERSGRVPWLETPLPPHFTSSVAPPPAELKHVFPLIGGVQVILICFEDQYHDPFYSNATANVSIF